MQPIHFALVGGGWRSEFYLRIAKALPEYFTIAGILLRNPEKRMEAEKRWGIRAYNNLEELVESCPAFTVLCVSKAAAPHWIKELSSHGLAVLAETPPAADSGALEELLAALPADARIQVAEQYPLQPMHQARTKLLASGKLGQPVHVQVSAAHGYHGISLIRHWLGHGDKAVSCTVSAQRLTAPILAGRVRNHLPEDDRLKDSVQDIALFRFDNGQSALLDFTYDQYFSPIRRNRILIRGTHGEIRDSGFDYMTDRQTAVTGDLRRITTGGEGSLEPLSLQGVLWGGEWLYRSPFHPAGFTDEDLAIAHMLVDMGAYTLGGGKPVYPLHSAVIDTRLAFCMEQAILSGREVRFEG
jgi:predicted dehydrogenase